VAIRAPLYVVITDFNGWQQTKECLLNLDRSSYTNIRIVVVDHGLSDETAIGLSEFPSVIRIAADSSLWWSGATNVGIRSARELGAQHIMLLNNDCYVNETTITRLMQYVDESVGRVIAPLQLSAHDGKVLVGTVGTCFALGFPTFVLPLMKDLSRQPENPVPTKMIVGGRGVVIPCSVFDKVGMFDENSLPHYGADHDFYLRCGLNNVQLAIAADATVLIDETKTTLSRDLGQMSVKEFLASFRDTRSHRNIGVLTTLFRRYFQVKSLYFIGVFLNISRYVITYLLKRILYSLKSLIRAT